MRYSLLIFDWDGTVIDSVARIVTSMQCAAQDLGLPAPEVMAVRDIIGLGLREALTKLFPASTSTQREALVSAYRDHFMERSIIPTPLFAGVRETLDQLQQRGYTLAIATGKGRSGLERALNEAKLKDYFAASRCADETASKPDPRMLHELLAETGYTSEQALMIGDTEYDMAMASAVGMAALAVSYGAHSKERLLHHAPIACIDAFADLITYVALDTMTDKDDLQ